MDVIIPLTEAQFQQQLLTLAEQQGWDWMHIGRTGKYVPNGAKGTLGKGWPDLVLVRKGTLLFIELKAQNGTLSLEQKIVYQKLSATGRLCYVWRPSDWPQAVEVLANA